jgi:hypothetical protein
MKLSLVSLAAAATVVNAAYPGDIVYYWYLTLFVTKFDLC